jgi:hypothetical protein
MQEIVLLNLEQVEKLKAKAPGKIYYQISQLHSALRFEISSSRISL